MKRYIAESSLLLNTIIWGATFILIKNALIFVSPMTFISLRFSVATLILIPFLFKILKQINKSLLFGGLLLGFLYFAGFATQTAGLKFTSATKSGFITGTFVVFTPLFQLLIEKRRPSLINILGIILVISGLLFLSTGGTSLTDFFNEIGNDFNLGDFLTLLCAVFFALYLVYLDIISKKFDFSPLVFIQIAFTGVGGIFLLLLFQISGIEQIKFSINGQVIFAVIYTSLLATILTTFLQTKYQKFVTPTKAGIIFSLEPIFAALFAFFLVNEKISNFGIIGCGFIFCGLLITEVFDNKKKEAGFTETG